MKTGVVYPLCINAMGIIKTFYGSRVDHKSWMACSEIVGIKCKHQLNLESVILNNRACYIVLFMSCKTVYNINS